MLGRLISGVTFVAVVIVAGAAAWGYLLATMWRQCAPAAAGADVFTADHGWELLAGAPAVLAALAAATSSAFLAFFWLPRIKRIRPNRVAVLAAALVTVVFSVSAGYPRVAPADPAPAGCPAGVPDWWPFRMS